MQFDRTQTPTTFGELAVYDHFCLRFKDSSGLVVARKTGPNTAMSGTNQYIQLSPNEPVFKLPPAHPDVVIDMLERDKAILMKKPPNKCIKCGQRTVDTYKFLQGANCLYEATCSNCGEKVYG